VTEKAALSYSVVDVADGASLPNDVRIMDVIVVLCAWAAAWRVDTVHVLCSANHQTHKT